MLPICRLQACCLVRNWREARAVCELAPEPVERHDHDHVKVTVVENHEELLASGAEAAGAAHCACQRRIT